MILDRRDLNHRSSHPRIPTAKSLLLSGLLLLLVAAGALDAQPAGIGIELHADDLKKIEQPRDPSAEGDAALSLDQLMEQHTTPALSVAVVKDYKLLWAKSYGYADKEAGREANVDTLFQAASISKPVSAMAVLRAVQDGKFGLDDDINDLLDSWKLIQNREYLETTEVTPRMLLSMTAGTTVPGFPGYLPTDTLPTVPQILGYGDTPGKTPANTDPVVVDWEPNTREQYSGGGSTILQLALSDVLDKPFEQILQETILDPLGMTKSCFCQPLPAELDQNATRAYGWEVRQDGYIGRPAKWHVYPELYAAGLWTTASDLAKFMIEVQLSLEGRSNKILHQSMVKKMVTAGGIGNYALGFTVGDVSPHRPARAGEENRFFGHTGGNWGFRANFVGHLEGGNGYIIMANSDDANPIVFYELPTRIRQVYGWK